MSAPVWTEEQKGQLRVLLLRQVAEANARPRHWTIDDDFDPLDPRPTTRKALMAWGLGWSEAKRMALLSPEDMAREAAETIVSFLPPTYLENPPEAE